MPNPRIPDVANDRARTAIDTALSRQFEGQPVTVDDHHALVHTFRDVLNEGGDVYETFDFADVQAILDGA